MSPLSTTRSSSIFCYGEKAPTQVKPIRLEAIPKPPLCENLDSRFLGNDTPCALFRHARASGHPGWDLGMSSKKDVACSSKQAT